jgi:LysM domain-containing protein
VGIPLSATSVANWMVRNDDPPAPPGAIEHMASHNFDPDRTTFGENPWLQTNVITPFVTPPARNAQLLLYDQFGFALQPQPGKIVLPTTVPGSSLGSGGRTPNLSDRRMMWSTWHVAVHEYLHNLVHPRFQNAIRGPVMNEGFTEYFTKGVLLKAAPVAHQNAGLVQKVEGGTFTPATTPGLVGPYATPPSYAANLTHVENVSRTVPGGDHALRASYFQGHVEMLGIDPATGAFVTTPPVSVDPTLVNVPAGIPNLDDLAVRSGVRKSEILSANVGLVASAALPPKLRLPGTREHRVASTLLSLGAGPTETAGQIASQNGVSVEALRRANPRVNWAALTSGQLVLIPRR